MDTMNQLHQQIATLQTQQTITETILQISRGLNTARNAHDLLMALAIPSIANGIVRASLSFIEPDEHGEPVWVEHVASWHREGKTIPPVGTRFYLPDFPAARLWIEHPDIPIFSSSMATDPRLDDHLKALGKAWGVQSGVWITVTQAGRWVAQVIFLWSEPHTFSEQEIAMYNALSPLAGPAVENLRLITTLEQKVQKRTADLIIAKQEAEHAKELAEKANQAKSTFLANMSHELRTPLSAILGFAQIMTRSQIFDAEQQENLSIIIRSGEYLLTLINQILNLSKIEAERITLNEKNFDLYRLLDELEDMFSLKAQYKHMQLVFERADDVPQYVRTDEIKLRQVLINLLNNAIKFTEEGGVTLRIESCELRNEPSPAPSQEGKSEIRNLKFEISDTGPGIAPDELDSLFDAFIQTKIGQISHEGTGLGLPISQKFVQLMGGEITVNSEVGHGTTFRFDITVSVIEASDIETRRSIRRRIIALEPDQAWYRILIVDDKPDNRKLLVKLLNPFVPSTNAFSPDPSTSLRTEGIVEGPGQGFELREAQNGREAIEIWEDWEPHLIWMDMRMPMMDGYEATKHIKATPKGRATVVIAVTASSFEEEQAVALSVGCDDFLRKPFQEAEIFDLMHKHLGVRFVYEEGEGQKAKGEGRKVEDVLTPEAFTAMPNELRVGLQHAVEVIDPKMAKNLIARIRGHNELLADELAELVKNYRFDTLQKLFEDIE
jgi:signal transduction histidine kinase/DNA-binding response OmpR family regulator